MAEIAKYAKQFDYEKFPGKTKQSFKEQCDVNSIIARFQSTGVPQHLNQGQASFGDFSNVDDYHSAMNKVRTAELGFSELPSALRSRFGNDPARLVEFLQDPENLDEAIELGLASKPVPTPPPEGENVETVPPAHSEATPPD